MENAKKWGALQLSRSVGALLSQDLLEVSVPAVPRVNCQSCRRVNEGTADDRIRCCDIVPRLPNFLVGEILSFQEHPVILTWIEQRRCDPFYFLPPPAMEAEHLAARKGGRYGLPCPMLVPGEGRCSIYAQRPVICMSYHCYVPDLLWREAWSCFQTTLYLLQDAVARVLVKRAGFSMQKMADVWASCEHEDEVWDGTQQKQAYYEAFWQHWLGRERDFFLWCFEQVCEDAQGLRWEAHRLHEQFQSGAEQNAPEARGLVEPPSVLRKKLRKRPQEPHEVYFSLSQMEHYLVWYLKQVEVPSWSQWWRSLWGDLPM